LIRDDGSDDATKNIINGFISSYPERVFNPQDTLGRLGPSGNFSALLSRSCAEYVMFCDQDDVWLPDKIQKTYELMQEYKKKYGMDTPILIHTDLQVVDSSLDAIADSFWAYQNIHPQGRESLNRLLPQNVVSGCTVMINASLRELALPIPQNAIMHDWWLALVAAAFGKIGHADEATILYRQHVNNEVGARNWHHIPSRIKLAADKKRAKESLSNTYMQAEAFLDRFADKLSPRQCQMVECYANFPQQIKIFRLYNLLKHNYFKAGFWRTLGMFAYV
jgi:glycosyltransferase involved in cell wall biosynthesis